MSFDLSRLLNLHRFPTPCRLAALRPMLKEAEALGMERLRWEIEDAIAADKALLLREEAWRARGGPRAGGKVKERERHQGRCLAAFCEGLSARSGGGLKPLGEKLRRLLFPKGLRAVTSQAPAERYAIVSLRLARLRRRSELTAALGLLGLERCLSSLERATERLGEELGAAPRERERAELRRASLAGHAELCRLVFRVIGLFPGADAAGQRRRFLAGVYRENQAIGDGLRAGAGARPDWDERVPA